MIRSIKFSSPLLLAFILSGCVINQTQKPAPVESARPATQVPQPAQPPIQAPPTPPQLTESQPQVQEVPQLPKLQSINWQNSVQPLVNSMMNTPGITPGSVLLVDRLKTIPMAQFRAMMLIWRSIRHSAVTANLRWSRQRS